MKEFLYTLLMSIMLFSQSLFGLQNDGFGHPTPPTTRNTLLNQIYTKLNHQIDEKYHLWLCGKGGKIQETIKIVMMAYNLRTNNPLSRDDARAMIVNIVEKYEFAFNQSEDIRPFLVKYPFDFSNFEITVYIYKNEFLDKFYDPEIFMVSTSKRGITFYTKSPTQRYGYASEDQESYEEALEKVKAQGKLDLAFIQG